jgi:hypothetical protein
MNKEQSEKRRAPRIDAALPVFFRNARGVTRDVSASGLFFWISESTCVLGELINLSVELTRRDAKLVLKCQGDVLRTEPGASGIGIAVQITSSAMVQVESP